MRGASGAFGGDKLVDPFAQVLQYEVLIRGRLAVVDFLGPLFERQLDAECLVDGKRDIEEIEAVDLEIVDRMTFRLNVLTQNLAEVSAMISTTLSNVVDIGKTLCNGTVWISAECEWRSEQPDPSIRAPQVERPV